VASNNVYRFSERSITRPFVPWYGGRWGTHLICNECEESQAFPKDIVELENSLGIPREELMVDMEKGKRCILCGSPLEESVAAPPLEKKLRNK
jgi:hypothetical protein